MKADWTKLPGEPGWVCKTDFGYTAMVKLSRAYPRGRTWRVLINGQTVINFIRDEMEARITAEGELQKLISEKTKGFA